jgi:hypothetical protein
LFTIENVELVDNEYISLVEENGKYYVIIEETPHDTYGLLTINLKEKEHEGYQSEPDGTETTDNTDYLISNYWKTDVSNTENNTSTKAKMSRKIIVPNVLETSEQEDFQTSETLPEINDAETTEENALTDEISESIVLEDEDLNSENSETIESIIEPAVIETRAQ